MGVLPLAYVPCRLKEIGAETCGAGDGEEYDDIDDGDIDSAGAKGLLELVKECELKVERYETLIHVPETSLLRQELLLRCLQLLLLKLE